MNVNINLKKITITLMICVSAQVIFAILNPYKYYEIAVSTYIYYCMHFVFGSLSLTLFSKRKLFTNIGEGNKDGSTRNQKLLAFIYASPCYIALVSSFIFVRRTGINIQDLRNTFFFGDGSALPFVFGDIVLYLSLFMGLGYYLLISFITRYKIYSGKADRDSAMIIGSGLFALDTATAGRMAFFYMALVIISTSLIFSRSQARIFSGRVAKRNISIILVIFLLVTSSRIAYDPSGSFLAVLYKYMVGPIYMMDQGLKDSSGLLHNPEVRLGMSLMTFDWTVIGILKKIGYELRTLFDISNNTLAAGYYLNDKGGMNAHFTAPFYFVIDYGYMSGAAIFVYSSIILSIYKARASAQYHSTIIIFLFFSQMLSTRENIYNSPTFMFTLFLLILFPMKSNSFLSGKVIGKK